MINTLTKLAEKIHQQFLINPKMKVIEVIDLVKSYNGTDWKNYQIFDSEKYNRIKVPIEENEFFDIYIINWLPNQISKIHDHANFGCIQKVLEGNLHERRYDTEDMKHIMTKIIKKKTKRYIDNQIAYHRVGNLTNKKVSSLHIYSPPNYQCNIFTV